MAAAQGSRDGSGFDQGPQPLGWRLAGVGHQVASGFREVLPPDLHPRHYAVLHRLRLAGAEGVSQSRVARELSIPPSRLVALVDDLEERGWARRDRSPADRRVQLVMLTPEGVEHAAELGRAAEAYEDRLTAGLTADELGTLRALLDRLGLPGPRGPHIW